MHSCTRSRSWLGLIDIVSALSVLFVVFIMSAIIVIETSLQHRICTSGGEVFLDLGGTERLDDSVSLPVVVSQASLRVLVRCRKTSDVAISLLGLEARSGGDARIGVGGQDE